LFVLNIFHQKDQVNARLHPFRDFLLQALSTASSATFFKSVSTLAKYTQAVQIIFHYQLDLFSLQTFKHFVHSRVDLPKKDRKKICMHLLYSYQHFFDLFYNELYLKSFQA